MANNFWTLLFTVLVLSSYVECGEKACLNDRYRPQFHFSQAANWINDPNGMVYYKGEYHLFYQYHPYSTVWGPMHWGHAVSSDLVHWEELPIALYPDELGQIFSGSAVVDSRNTSGLQQSVDEDVIVAIFTHEGGSQVQSLAYSNDRGRNFQKFVRNPVLPNPPGVIDFRDPKVIDINGKWVMALAVGNKISFYGCEDLISWSPMSEFGADPPQGGHGGVWECPDLFPLEFDGQTVWVLLVSINPGGPNLGSVTQYFLGDFDGLTFRSFYPGEEPVLWMDWGPDNYAGVTFSNEPNNKRILMGWMQNWIYSADIPTAAWRGQMTIPRELVIKMVEGRLRLASVPVPEMSLLRNPDEIYSPPNIGVISSGSILVLTSGMPFTNHLLELDLTLQFDGFAAFGVCFYNGVAQELCFGYEHANSQFFLDRSRSGNVNFHPDFSRRAIAARESRSRTITFKVFLDDSSIEIFADGGTTVMTALFYPDQPFTVAHIHHYEGESVLEIQSATLRGLHSIHDCN
nr:putative GH32 family protein [Pogonognathellus flavescens]WEI57527.1 putative GH32 family protein [Pogonognathellus flavescens]